MNDSEKRMHKVGMHNEFVAIITNTQPHARTLLQYGPHNND